MSTEIIKYIETKMKIPYAVIHRHIIPYTYLLQSKQLLRDIRSYKQDYDIIMSHYSTQYNDNILIADILFYYKVPLRLVSILMRHAMYMNRNPSDMYTLIISMYYNYNTNNVSVHRIIRTILGLMRPEERTRFINKYIIIILC
jgi:hypothetical protein